MFQVKGQNEVEWEEVDEVSVRCNMRDFVCQDREKWQQSFDSDVREVNQMVKDMKAGKVVECGGFEWRWVRR